MKIKIALVSSIGGHLTELNHISDTYKSFDHFYVFNSKIQSNELSNKNCHFIKHSERDLFFLKNIAECLKIIKKENPTHVISFGAGLIIPFLLSALILRHKLNCIYVETLASQKKISLTGKIIQYFNVYRISQSEELYKKYKFHNLFIPSLKYLPLPKKQKNRKIFIGFGNLKKRHRTLENISRKVIEIFEGEVYIQLGHSLLEREAYEKKDVHIFSFKSKEDITKIINDCNTHIIHGGVGLFSELKNVYSHTFIVPRLKSRDEHINDHQLEIISLVENNQNISVIYTYNDFLNSFNCNINEFDTFKHMGFNYSELKSIIDLRLSS